MSYAINTSVNRVSTKGAKMLSFVLLKQEDLFQ